jgi:hypothetical protein
VWILSCVICTENHQPALDRKFIDPRGDKTSRCALSTAAVAVISRTIHRE